MMIVGEIFNFVAYVHLHSIHSPRMVSADTVSEDQLGQREAKRNLHETLTFSDHL